MNRKKAIIYATVFVAALTAVYIVYITVFAFLHPTRITVNYQVSTDPLWECTYILQDQIILQTAAQNSAQMQNIVRQVQYQHPITAARNFGTQPSTTRPPSLVLARRP